MGIGRRGGWGAGGAVAGGTAPRGLGRRRPESKAASEPPPRELLASAMGAPCTRSPPLPHLVDVLVVDFLHEAVEHRRPEAGRVNANFILDDREDEHLRVSARRPSRVLSLARSPHWHTECGRDWGEGKLARRAFSPTAALLSPLLPARMVTAVAATPHSPGALRGRRDLAAGSWTSARDGGLWKGRRGKLGGLPWRV